MLEKLISDIVGPEIIFSNKHILIIYLKTTFIKVKKGDTSSDKNSSKKEVFDIEKNLDISDLE